MIKKFLVIKKKDIFKTLIVGKLQKYRCSVSPAEAQIIDSVILFARSFESTEILGKI